MISRSLEGAWRERVLNETCSLENTGATELRVIVVELKKKN